MSGGRAFGSVGIRAVQRWGINRLRRSRFFPVTIPDKLGDDDRLAGTTLRHRVLVYFPDTQESLYQILPWLPAFEALDEQAPVVIVCQDSRTAAALRRSTDVDVLTIARYGRLDDVLARSDVALALYVSHSSRNFDCLRFTTMLHVYLGHGDSDKGVSVSNQVKAYDFCFVAGQAAVDRIATRVPRYDASRSCRIIGQPQLDAQPWVAGAHSRGERATVLYAPTWEGAQPSVAYSSVLSHGEAVVRSILDDDALALVYRPHPLTGVTSKEYGVADGRIRALVEEAARLDPEAGHVVDLSGTLERAFASADVLVCDVSGVALQWLPTGRPFIVTAPATPDALVAETAIARAVPHLDAGEAHEVAALLRHELETDPGREAREGLIAYYLSDVAPGAATTRFVEAALETVRERDTIVEELAAARAAAESA